MMKRFETTAVALAAALLFGAAIYVALSGNVDLRNLLI
jgi:hypothetical protein